MTTSMAGRTVQTNSRILNVFSDVAELPRRVGNFSNLRGGQGSKWLVFSSDARRCSVVGTNLQQVVFRAVYLDLNVRLQSEALRLGRITYLTPQKTAATSATTLAISYNKLKPRSIL